MIKAALAKALTVKVGLALGTAAAAGGVAVAASTGTIPNPFHGKPAASHSPAPKDNAAKGSPSPSLHGLCNAYFAGSKADRGKSLESPAFRALIDEAGGKEKVEAFCADLEKKSPEARPSHEGAGGKPSTKPSVPAGKPSVLPSKPNH